MNKEDWEKLREELYKIHSDFLVAYNKEEYGSNKQIRTDGERDTRRLIRSALSLLNRNSEAFNLLTSQGRSIEASEDTYGVSIFMSEFAQSRHFGDDMSDLLDHIQLKIESFNS